MAGTLWERLTAAELATQNALADDQIRAALATYGYDEARIQQGYDLFTAARELAVTQQSDYGDQYGATAELSQTWETAQKNYMRDLKVARIALRDNAAAEAALKLNGKRKKSFSGWMEQAQTFYGNMLENPEYVTEMGRFGYTQEGLLTAIDEIQAVIDANLAQESSKGIAQDATRQRDARADEMDQWMSDFKAISLLALEDNSQMLEKLGFGAIP